MSAVAESAAPLLGLALDGVGWHPAAWRADPDGVRRVTDPRRWLELVRAAEDAGFDDVSFEDGFEAPSDGRDGPPKARLDSILVASYVAPLTDRIGLIPTATVTHIEPFHLAKAIATLDHASRGRAGIRLRAGIWPAQARLVGRRRLPEVTPESLGDPAAQAAVTESFDEVEDVAEVLRRLWDSWEDDAEIRDVATGRFIDRDKLHYADFTGRWFSVKGPLTVPRSPQGQPVVAVLGHGELPYRLAAVQGDLLWVTPKDAADAARIVTDVREVERAVRTCTQPLRIVGDVHVVLDRTEAAARRRLEELDALADAPASDAHTFAGTTEQLRQLVSEWTEGSGLDGLRFRPATHARDLPPLFEAIAGLRGPGRGGATTLRSALGLPRPSSRYAPTEAS